MLATAVGHIVRQTSDILLRENRWAREHGHPDHGYVTSNARIPRPVAVSHDTGLDPACLLPGMILVDDADSPGDMLDALLLGSRSRPSSPRARRYPGCST